MNAPRALMTWAWMLFAANVLLLAFILAASPGARTNSCDQIPLPVVTGAPVTEEISL